MLSSFVNIGIKALKNIGAREKPHRNFSLLLNLVGMQKMYDRQHMEYHNTKIAEYVDPKA